MEIVSNLQPSPFGLNVRTKGPRSSICVRTLSQFTITTTDLTHANLSYARVWGTIFGNVDLSVAKGLEAIRYKGPSTIGIDTIYRSKGNIPEVFLKGAGVQESFLTLSLASRLRSRRSASRRNRRRATAYTGLILGARRLAP